MIKHRILFLILYTVSLCPVVLYSEYDFNFPFLENLENCLAIGKINECKFMITKFEELQLNQYAKGNLRCQTVILGLQSEIIRKIYFERKQKNSLLTTVPYLIKNC